MSTLLYVVVLIGVLVFVHEFGHFVVARLFKIKVLSFSIGFGPRLFGFKRNETDWVVRLLPLGGYVQMLGSDPFEQVPLEDRERAFGNQPLWKRALVILAGPMANLLLPIPILFFVMLSTFDKDLPPIVGEVLDGTPAEGKLFVGDEVVAINGEEVRYWSQLVQIVRDAPGEDLDLTVLRDGEQVSVRLRSEETVMRDEFDIFSPTVGRIGVTTSQYAPLVGVDDPNGPAARAGLQTFDEIAAVDGQPIRAFSDLDRIVRHSGGKTLELLVLRDRPVDVPFGRVAVQDPLRLTLIPAVAGEHGDAGFGSAEMYIAQVDPNTPAARAGVQRGDRIVSMDGKHYNLFSSLSEDMQRDWESPHTIELLRNGETFEVLIQLEKVTVIGEFQEERPVIVLGMYNQPRRVLPEPRAVPFGDRIGYAASSSVSMTVQASTMLVVALYRMAEGRVSTKSIGGPIMIGHMASKAGEAGIDEYLRMLALISINLGIINLLPIPVLDGGHLLLFALEGLKRGPLSMRTRQVASFIGLAIVVFLMIFAFKNDLERYWEVLFG